ncbi:hypothetical protein FC83_GL003099 [Agrilactobacillus composti DSM 18527 = JCM 14202]|uniref:Uncharacterized protein n=1 Tax=Agrilactobacillus composti DSM 18527 = JCM 14202 TaxID=1423734 RepID=X0PCV6_9LACO|nr:hypothetical protein [Agrilactobacillus composti]KRM33026.1 hypothetical protein FC83_GL003099 [Agrilactobacillus composti DSM 18527 = JCM 14202]GAF38629.1 hypothetical protein JCM14202_450 [Agrilactobacillus composti DSM 18527 = JCM 14202]
MQRADKVKRFKVGRAKVTLTMHHNNRQERHQAALEWVGVALIVGLIWYLKQR